MVQFLHKSDCYWTFQIKLERKMMDLSWKFESIHCHISICWMSQWILVDILIKTLPFAESPFHGSGSHDNESNNYLISIPAGLSSACLPPHPAIILLAQWWSWAGLSKLQLGGFLTILPPPARRSFDNSPIRKPVYASWPITDWKSFIDIVVITPHKRYC